MSRRGFLSLWLLLSFSAVITVMAGFLLAAAHTVRAESAAAAGLRAQYAAESAAVWALEYAKRYGTAEKTTEFSLGADAKCKAKVGPGELCGMGEDAATGALRYVRLTTAVTETDAGYRVVVNAVDNGKW